MRRLLAFVLISFTIVCGCSRPGATNEKSAADVGQPVKGDWAVVRYETDPDNLNPLLSTVGVGHYAMWGVNNSQIYELLLQYDTKTWTFTEPLLAEGPPTVSDDHMTY